jgi:DMSO/TMAO reductase YedYZ molybdopterin-dependent catalytic subunit
MSPAMSRRKMLKTGLGAAAGVGALGAGIAIGDRCGLIPANHRGLYGLSETLTYAGQRLLTTLPSMAREFNRGQITKVPPVNGPAPKTEAYQRLKDTGFADWRLTVDGMVTRPASFSLVELKSFPSRTQITHQACEEGWSFIAEWTGVLLSDVLTMTGVDARARYVVFIPYDQWWDSLELQEALHPQTLLAWGMNGEYLSLDHGAPLRLRVPKQMGYKSIKFLSRIRVVDTLEDVGRGLGSASAEAGYAWYAGI